MQEGESAAVDGSLPTVHSDGPRNLESPRFVAEKAGKDAEVKRAARSMTVGDSTFSGSVEAKE